MVGRRICFDCGNTYVSQVGNGVRWARLIGIYVENVDNDRKWLGGLCQNTWLSFNWLYAHLRSDFAGLQKELSY